MLDEQFIFLGAGINFLAGLGYVIAVLRGQARPNRITWLIWAVAGWIAFAGQLVEGVALPAVLTGVVAAVPTLILLASLLRRGTAGRTTRLDWVCLAAAGCGIAVLFFVSGTAAITAGILVHALGAVPTVIKTYRAPESEAHIAYTAGVANSVCTLLTLDPITYDTAAFATYFLCLCTVLSFLILRGPRLTRSHAQATPSSTAPTAHGARAALPEPGASAAGSSGAARQPYASPSDNLVREVAAFAAAFAVVWNSSDPARPRQRGERLAGYLADGPAEVRGRALLEALQGRQVVDHVFTGAVTPVGPRALRVELRLQYTRHSETGDEARWQRMWVTVLRRADGQLMIEPGTVLAVDEHQSSPARTAGERPGAPAPAPDSAPAPARPPAQGPVPAPRPPGERIGARPVPPVPETLNGQVKDYV